MVHKTGAGQLDSIVDGVQYVSCLAGSFIPGTTYVFRPTAATATETTIGTALKFMTNHSSLGQFSVISSSPNSCDLFTRYVPGNQRSVLTISYFGGAYFRGAVSVDTIEAGTDEISIAHQVSNLTPSSSYSFLSEIRTIDGPYSTSQAIGSVMTMYDSTSRGILTPLYFSNSYGSVSVTTIVNFGVHTSGSSCIDPMLEELSLPPWPPGGPEARSIGNCLDLGLYHDFHLYYSPSQVDTYKIKFQPYYDIYPMHLSWPDLSSRYSGPVTLVTSDTTIDMKSVNEYSIENPDISVFRIYAGGPMPRPYLPIIAGRAIMVRANSPELSSIIITNGLPSEAWFEWGTTPAYGNETPHKRNANGEMVLRISNTFPGFGTDTTYFMRTVARNTHGTYYGSQQSIVSSVTGVKPAAGLPKEFELEQNYPNPFNPTTTLKYALPTQSRVHLTILDVLGQVVATLLDDVEQMGYKTVEWNAIGVASGLYLYRLEARSVADPNKSFTEVKKMLLIR